MEVQMETNANGDCTNIVNDEDCIARGLPDDQMCASCKKFVEEQTGQVCPKAPYAVGISACKHLNAMSNIQMSELDVERLWTGMDEHTRHQVVVMYMMAMALDRIKEQLTAKPQLPQ
jgi:hypothetical protein